MRNTIVSIALASIASLLFIVPAQSAAQCRLCGNGACGSVEQQVQGMLHLADPPFVTHRPDLEEDVIDLQYVAKMRIADGAKAVSYIQILEARRQGYRIENGKVIAAVVDLDDAPVWRFAYDCDSAHIFPLYGFPDSQSGFNAMIRRLDLAVDSDKLALAVLSTLIKTHIFKLLKF